MGATSMSGVEDAECERDRDCDDDEECDDGECVELDAGEGEGEGGEGEGEGGEGEGEGGEGEGEGEGASGCGFTSSLPPGTAGAPTVHRSFDGEDGKVSLLLNVFDADADHPCNAGEQNLEVIGSPSSTDDLLPDPFDIALPTGTVLHGTPDDHFSSWSYDTCIDDGVTDAIVQLHFGDELTEPFPVCDIL
jgi:hypothetical protein